MTKFWSIALSILLGVLIIAVLACFVALAIYAIDRVFDELMKH